MKQLLETEEALFSQAVKAFRIINLKAARALFLLVVRLDGNRAEQAKHYLIRIQGSALRLKYFSRYSGKRLPTKNNPTEERSRNSKPIGKIRQELEPKRKTRELRYIGDRRRKKTGPPLDWIRESAPFFKSFAGASRGKPKTRRVPAARRPVPLKPPSPRIGGDWKGSESYGEVQGLFYGTKSRKPTVDSASAPVLDLPQGLRRTPHMDISPTPSLEPGAKVKVSIYTDTTPLRQGEEGGDIVLEVPPNQKQFTVMIWLVVSGPFEIEGQTVQSLTVLRDQKKSKPTEFTVLYKSSDERIRPALFSAFFTYKGRACGQVRRTVMFSAAKLPQSPSELPSQSLSGPPGSSNILIDPDAQQPDLSIQIVESGKDKYPFQCLVQTLLLRPFRSGRVGPWELPPSASDFVQEKMERFTSPDASDYIRTTALRSAGKELFKASPEIFQKVFWALIDSGKKLRTISIVTQEPFIPWELMVPIRTLPDGKEEEREPLGVEFLISRWTSKEEILAPQQVSIRDAWVVAPRDSDPFLESAEAEADMVLKRISGERIDPALVKVLDSILEKGSRTLLHFVCHGKSGKSGTQILTLENKEELAADLLNSMDGLKKAFKKSNPFVFLNACEVGRQEPALIGVGGFAEQFMELGASGVIAPLWSVKDSIAHQVAVEFYKCIEEKPQTPFAEILRDLRKRSYVKEGGEDTWAAYCFYGDPLAARAKKRTTHPTPRAPRRPPRRPGGAGP